MIINRDNGQAVPRLAITDNREYDMKLFLLILTSILSIGSISWKDLPDISQNNGCIFRDTLVGYVDYDNVLDSIYIEKTSEYRYDDKHIY